MENNNATSSVRPIDSFDLHLKIFVVAGFYKPLKRFNSDIKNLFHRLYIYVVFVLMTVYSIQHVIFIIQTLDDLDHVVASLIVLLEIMNSMYKIFMMNLKSKQLDRIFEVVNGSYFAAESDYDKEICKKNKVEMVWLLRMALGGVYVCGTLWGIAPLANLAVGNYLIIPAYFPFDKKRKIGYIMAALYESIVITWIGTGDMTFDCFVAAFYSQVKVQLRTLRNQLEHLADIANGQKTSINVTNKKYSYRDEDQYYSIKLRERMKHCMNKYDAIIDFNHQLEAVFNSCMIAQLLISVCMLGIVVYRLVTMNLLSFEFMNLAQYLICLLIELFLFCYYGTQIEYESQFINQSLFGSEWTSLSPRFRRGMSIAMARWGRDVSPRVAYIVPLSLNTFIGVLRISYSLYTILKHT